MQSKWTQLLEQSPLRRGGNNFIKLIKCLVATSFCVNHP